MTSPDTGQPGPTLDPPVTGEASVDQALATLADLVDQPLNAQHERLSQAHEALHATLDRPSGQPG